MKIQTKRGARFMRNKFMVCAFAALALCLAVSGAAYSANSAENWKVYENGRFGYSVEYPDIFSISKEPDNGDGTTFESKDGECTLMVWGGHNVSGYDGNALLEAKKNEVSHIVPDSQRSGEKFYAISYSDDGGSDGNEHIFREYGIVNSSLHAGVVFRYPKDEEERFAAMAVRVEDSLKLPESGQSGGAKPIDISAYTLKNGRVYKGGVELDCEVYDVPSEVEGSIRHWSAFGTETSDIVPEAETGVWFFSESGEALTFVPLESEDACQGVVFSLDGARFVLVTGSEMRPDVSFEVYGEGTEKIAELSAIRGGPHWIDPVRFVFTRIDDARGDGERVWSSGRAYGWRVSVVIYDTAAKEEIVLKEATDTRNYWLSDVSWPNIISGDGKVLIREEFVESEKDWGDEDKTKEREIEAEIPAAG